MNLSCAYIDCLAEGITAVITKLNNQLKAIEELDGKKKEEGDDSMKAYGIYNSIKIFFQSISTFLGGFLAQHISLGMSAIIISGYSFVIIAYIVLVFREEKVSKININCFLTLN